MKLTQISDKQKQQIFNGLTILGTILTIWFMWWAYQEGLLTDTEKMKIWINSFGPAGVLVFIFIQIVQTVIPIIPGALTTVAGVVVFGAFWGSIWNFTGIIIGSVILFLITRHYGEPFIRSLVKPETYEKYTLWVKRNEKRFDLMFAIAMASPVSPADLIVMMAALTPIKFKKFFYIILICKPISIFCYSIATKEFLGWLFSFFA